MTTLTKERIPAEIQKLNETLEKIDAIFKRVRQEELAAEKADQQWREERQKAVKVTKTGETK